MPHRYCPDNWARLSALLEQALDLPEEQRQPWIDSHAAESGEIKAQLLRLLAEATPARDFLRRLPDFAAAISGEADRIQLGHELQPDHLVGGYRLVRELGRGGMGSVWLARRADGKFKRDVALKFPYAGPHQRQLIERLARERDILAGLQHVNIARLYDADVTATGQPYLVLEYIDGAAISDYCDRNRLDIRARLQLFRQVVSAVRYAHAHLVIHRDLKPSNILVTNDGVVHLLDFGIATSVADGFASASALTRFGGHMATPEYSSPEQLSRSALTTASDVYSLGVVLYELLTGTLPYPWRREQRAQLEQAVANGDVMTPSRAAFSEELALLRDTNVARLRRTLRGELDILMMKALKRRPEERYASADALADDISRHLEHRPILAQPDSRWYQVSKFVRRNRVAVSSLTAVAIALIGGAGIALWQAHAAAQQRDRAVALASRGQAITEFMRLLVTEMGDADEPVPIATLLQRTEEVATTSTIGDPDQQVAVLEVLGEYYLNLQRSELASRSYEKALKLAASSADSALQARLRCEAGRAHSQLGDDAAAEKYIATGLAMAREYPDARVICLQARADLDYAAGDIGRMLQDITSAQQIMRVAGVRNPMLQIELMADFADAQVELGHIAEAQRAYASTIEQLNALGRGEQSVAMIIHSNWAIADHYAGNPRSALAHLDRALAIARKRGVHEDEAAIYVGRAQQLYQLGRYEEALHDGQVAQQSAEKNHNAMMTAIAKQWMARTRLALGQVAPAELLMKQAEAMIGATVPEEGIIPQVAGLLRGLLALEQHRCGDAIPYFSKNIDALLANNRRISTLTYTLFLRGKAHVCENDFDAAFEDGVLAYEVAQSLKGASGYSKNSGEAALLLARAASGRGDPDTARKWIAIACQELRGSLGNEHPTTQEALQLSVSLQ